MSITHKKKYLDGYINPNKLSIIQFDKDMNKLNEWDSISDAAKFYNIDRMAIANCIHNRTKTSKGFIWKFKNEII